MYGSEKFEDTKGVIRIRISKKHRKHKDQEKKRTNNDLQNMTHKTKDRVTRTPCTISLAHARSTRLSQVIMPHNNIIYTVIKVLKYIYSLKIKKICNV